VLAWAGVFVLAPLLIAGGLTAVGNLTTSDEVTGPPRLAEPPTKVGADDLGLGTRPRPRRFQGPFDLLLAVLLREEISLSEVPLGEIVIAYVDHMGDAEDGSLDLEAVTEFLVLNRSALRAQIAAAAAKRGGRRGSGRRRPPMSCFARMLEYRATSEAATMLSSAWTGRAASCTGRRRCLRELATRRPRRRDQAMSPTASALPSATC